MTFTSIQLMNYGVLNQFSDGSSIISQKNRLFYAGASCSDDNSKKIYYSKPRGRILVDQKRKTLYHIPSALDTMTQNTIST